MKAEKRIKELGIELPELAVSKTLFLPVKLVGNTLYVSGQLPFAEGKLAYTGKVGNKVTLEQAREAARLCVINLLAVLKAYLGDLDRVKSIVKLQVFVSSEEHFTQQHVAADAASQLLIDIFGDCGRHSRTAAGLCSLAMDAPVEVDGIVEIQG